PNRPLFRTPCEFQSNALCDTPVRVRILLPVAAKAAGNTLVYATILHVTVLYKLQHQLSPLLHVWYYIPQMFMAAYSQEVKESLQVPLQSSAIHLSGIL
ncbi:hypothetical protein L9F63_014203, partial [Diploptera punctata]